MELFVHDANIYVDSTVIRIDGNRPYKVNDSLVLGQDWTVKQLDLEIQNLKKSLHLLSDGKGRWFNEKGEEIYPLRGAADLDLSCTPFTNSLPINRLPWQRNDARDLETGFGVEKSETKVSVARRGSGKKEVPLQKRQF